MPGAKSILFSSSTADFGVQEKIHASSLSISLISGIVGSFEFFNLWLCNTATTVKIIAAANATTPRKINGIS